MISVIIPVYNAEHTIRPVVESINEDDAEIILVDDASADKSLSICLDIADRDPRVKVLSLKENLGCGNARNEGLKAASGEFVSFADADDLAAAGIHRSALKAMGDADWIVWGVRECFPSGKTKDSIPLSSEIIELEKQMLFGYAWNKLYRRSIIKAYQIRFPDTKLYEDYFFNIEYAKHSGRIERLEQIGYLYNKGDGNRLTNRYIPDYYPLAKRRIASMLDYYNEYVKMTDRDTVNDVLGNRYLRYLLSALARSYDPRAGLNRTDRCRWIEEVCKDRLYLTVSAACKAEHPAYGILQRLLNRHKTGAIDRYGRAVYRIWSRREAAGKRRGVGQ